MNRPAAGVGGKHYAADGLDAARRRRDGGDAATAAYRTTTAKGSRTTMIDLTDPSLAPAPKRKPEWLKVTLAHGATYERLKADVAASGLHTVCQEAMCPNIGECWGAGTATIMILGDTCTRGCHFCNVKTGSPRGDVDWMEPRRVAESVRDLGWQYLVLTAVDRDDLADGGAAIFASTVRAIHKLAPGAKVECLTGDFAGDLAALDVVLAAEPEVLAHNLETVRRLTPTVRDRRATFDRSLAILAHAKTSRRTRYTKTSLMLGLGETEAEIEEAMDAARSVGVDIFTMGQYLQPTKRHLDVVEFVTPQTFERLRVLGLSKGFRQVVSSPLSRSSYHAERAFP
ncbi:MAG: lipoyl synthase [Vulcanimicrobiaceae bacterium]